MADLSWPLLTISKVGIHPMVREEVGPCFSAGDSGKSDSDKNVEVTFRDFRFPIWKWGLGWTGPNFTCLCPNLTSSISVFWAKSCILTGGNSSRLSYNCVLVTGIQNVKYEHSSLFSSIVGICLCPWKHHLGWPLSSSGYDNDHQ